MRELICERACVQACGPEPGVCVYLLDVCMQVRVVGILQKFLLSCFLSPHP